MSDIIVKIIPIESDLKLSEEVTDRIAQWVKRKYSGEVIVRNSDEIEFVDCGDQLEKIRCPYCDKELSFDWWGETMDAAAANGFEDLDTELLCCGKKASLNKLDYEYPCGFSKTEVSIWNPQKEITTDELVEFSEMIGIHLRIIQAHI